jgi:hypothetical protein
MEVKRIKQLSRLWVLGIYFVVMIATIGLFTGRIPL